MSELGLSDTRIAWLAAPFAKVKSSILPILLPPPPSPMYSLVLPSVRQQGEKHRENQKVKLKVRQAQRNHGQKVGPLLDSVLQYSVRRNQLSILTSGSSTCAGRDFPDAEGPTTQHCHTNNQHKRKGHSWLPVAAWRHWSLACCLPVLPSDR